MEYMKKKILAIVIALVMLFTAAGLTACGLNNLTLAEYQTAARVDLTNYANSRGRTNFTTENWAVIQGHVTTGKAAIDAAGTKPAVRTARDNAKAAVRAVERENNVNNYTRHPNSVDTINAQLENRIREDFVQVRSEHGEIDFTMQDVWVNGYFGTYNDSSVVMIRIMGIDGPPAIGSFMIEDMEFFFNYGHEYLVWNDGNFYTLETAHSNGLLHINDIRAIYAIIWGT